jgi:hypothetical protein
MRRLGLVLFALATLGCAASTTASTVPEREAEAPPPPPPPALASPAPPGCAAVHALGGYCFPTVEAACRALPCSNKGCSIGYSLPPVVSCAAPGEGAALPGTN